MGSLVATILAYTTIFTTMTHISRGFIVMCLAAMIEAIPPKQPSKVIAAESVSQVKQINILLNLPPNCSTVYDGLIGQLEACKSDSSREGGCHIKLNLSNYREDCHKSELIVFPEDRDHIDFPLTLD